MRQQPYNLHCQQITKFYYQILWLKYWHNLQQNHPAQTPSSVFRQLSSERKFANGAITGAFSRVFNDELHGSQEESTSSGNASNDSETDNEHFYSVGPTALYNTSNQGCTLQNALSIVDIFSIPTTFFPKEGTYDIKLLGFIGGDPILHLIDRENFTISNITKPGHTFHPGTVVHKLTESNGTIYLNTIGRGSGKWPEFNNIVGRFLFRNTHYYSKLSMRRITEPNNELYYRE